MKRHHFTRGKRGSGWRPGSSSSLFTIPIDGVHFAALSASPRTPREMMHDRPGPWNTQMASRVRSTRRSRIGAPLAFPARTQNA
jgi:hypothetical protein